MNTETDQEENDLINIKEFLNVRVDIVREDYFERNKNVKECVKNDMDLPESAIEKLEIMCK